MRTNDSTARATTPFEQRLLAEVIRRDEEKTGAVTADPAVELAAISAGGDFEARVLARADAVAGRIGLHRTLARVRRTVGTSVAILLLGGVLLGAGAAKATLTPDAAGLVNFYWVLLALLGVHILALLLWLIAIALSPRLAPATPLRPLLRTLLHMLAFPPGRGSASAGALDTWTGIHTGGAMGRWAISSLSHGFWLAALAGMLGTVLLLLSARQFDFVWETTILPERTFVAVTEQLSVLPRRLGLPTPTQVQITASRRAAAERPPAEARGVWSGLLIGSLVAYGLAPRAALLLLAVLLYRRARKGFRLDLNHPGYARLRPLLMPASRRIGIVDPNAVGEQALRPGAMMRRLPVGSQLAVLGLEIEPPGTGWPPPLASKPRDLGIATDRASQEAALKTLAALQRSPMSLLLIASLAASPDRGLARLLREIRAVHHGPLALLLTQSGKASERLGQHAFTERAADWRQLALNAGIDAASVGTLDLDDVAAVRDCLAARDPDGSAEPRA
ncbi:MAG: DUF2868 domain-containing protein [Chromatiales bacterium]